MSYLVKEIPISERPRERLMRYGAKSLANHELLAIILRTGSFNNSVLDLAKEILIHFEDLDNLNNATIEELKQIKGIGEAKAITIIAAIELGKRVNTPISPNMIINSPVQSYNYLKDLIQHETQENLVCVFLNNQSQVITTKTITIGTLNHTIFNPRDILKWALKLSAAAIIVSHNHPSGNPTPSNEDIIVTKKLVQAARLVDVIIVDHLIIGKNRYYSFLENKKL